MRRKKKSAWNIVHFVLTDTHTFGCSFERTSAEPRAELEKKRKVKCERRKGRKQSEKEEKEVNANAASRRSLGLRPIDGSGQIWTRSGWVREVVLGAGTRAFAHTHTPTSESHAVGGFSAGHDVFSFLCTFL